VFGAWISVSRKMYDSNDSDTNDVKLSVKNVFEIIVHRSLN